MSGSKGLVYVFTGDGKGKTSAALGVAVRAACAGKWVAVVQWYKSRQWDVSEYRLPELLASTRKYKKVEKSRKRAFGEIAIYPMGEGFHLANSNLKSQISNLKSAPLRGGGVVVDTASEEEHRRAAKEALQLAKELLSSQLTTQNSKLFLLILDEVINAVNDHLLALPDLLALLELRGSTHLILTGRGAPKTLIEMADLVTEMKNVKHPYDIGKMAIRGLDF